MNLETIGGYMNIERAKSLVRRSSVYVPESGEEPIRIRYWDSDDDIMEEQMTDESYTGFFYGTGEETAMEDIAYSFGSVTKLDLFYVLTLDQLNYDIQVV